MIFILVGGFKHFLFFHSVGNVIIPTDFHIFQRGRLNHQPVFVRRQTKEHNLIDTKDCHNWGDHCLDNLGEIGVSIASAKPTFQGQHQLYYKYIETPSKTSRSNCRGCPMLLKTIPLWRRSADQVPQKTL